MSNRTDFSTLTDEIVSAYRVEQDGLRHRIETELHNAFVAGQESETVQSRTTADRTVMSNRTGFSALTDEIMAAHRVEQRALFYRDVTVRLAAEALDWNEMGPDQRKAALDLFDEAWQSRLLALAVVPQSDKVDAAVRHGDLAVYTNNILQLSRQRDVTDAFERLPVNVVELLRTLTSEKRVNFFNEFRSAFCEHCGRDQPHGNYCQCDNDE